MRGPHTHNSGPLWPAVARLGPPWAALARRGPPRPAGGPRWTAVAWIQDRVLLVASPEILMTEVSHYPITFSTLALENSV